MAQQKFHNKRRINTKGRDEPIGTQEELLEDFKIAESYLYKIISYAEREEVPSKEEVDKERRIFQFAKQGPRAAHFRLSKRGKLTSADVLYFLTTTQPSEKLAEKFGVAGSKIREIRRGDSEEWIWEYYFVRRMRAILKGEMTRINKQAVNYAYSISKVHSPTKTEILYYTTCLRKAKALRESIITKVEFKKLTNNKTLDIIYPIDKIEILK